MSEHKTQGNDLIFALDIGTRSVIGVVGKAEGDRFKVLDALVTNFHLPESTLIMLVSALAGREHTLAAYEEAVKERYRFFSFGDAMLIH